MAEILRDRSLKMMMLCCGWVCKNFQTASHIYSIQTDVSSMRWKNMRIHKLTQQGLRTRLEPVYSRAGESRVSYVHSYPVQNTLLQIIFLTCLVSTMVPSGFGPYHGMWLEVTQTKCIGVIPTPWVMMLTLGLVSFPRQHKQLTP